MARQRMDFKLINFTTYVICGVMHNYTHRDFTLVISHIINGIHTNLMGVTLLPIHGYNLASVSHSHIEHQEPQWERIIHYRFGITHNFIVGLLQSHPHPINSTSIYGFSTFPLSSYGNPILGMGHPLWVCYNPQFPCWVVIGEVTTPPCGPDSNCGSFELQTKW